MMYFVECKEVTVKESILASLSTTVMLLSTVSFKAPSGAKAHRFGSLKDRNALVVLL